MKKLFESVYNWKRGGLSKSLVVCMVILTSTSLVWGESHSFENEEIIGTSMSVKFECSSDTLATDTYAKVLKEVERLRKIYDYRLPDSELSLLVKKSRGQYLPVSRELLSVLKLGKAGYKKSEGRYNYCGGQVVSLWKKAESTKHLPSYEEIKAVVKRAESIAKAVMIDEKNMKVAVPSGANIDLDSLAKGAIIDDLITGMGKFRGVKGAVVNIGGDVRVGDDQNGTMVSVKDTEGNEVSKLTLKNRAIATSGGKYR
ncbi:MAG: FAD:protein FMN transferase [Rubritalea sp.]|uniref:FAD:protein FMN transferase n=1 Tax=Rubritalea sp. TaxID=2109375 RepID=UPI0032427242